ncbi:MAG: hypothetical protein II811_04425 [Spirochaetaceae bacterium]|nr:hypothetical protein [Spirochaetaceae bacterium]
MQTMSFSDGITSIGDLFPDVNSPLQTYCGAENAWAAVARAFERTGNTMRLAINNAEVYHGGQKN